MKKIITSFLSILMVSGAFAQFTYGPKLGGNISRLSDDKLMPGFQFGGFLNAELHDRIGVQVDFLWTLKGSRNIADSLRYQVGATQPTKYQAITKTYYRFVDVPICVYFPISKHIRGFAGPQLTVFRGANETFKGAGAEVERKVKGIEGKTSFCAGFDLNLDSPITFGLRFTTNNFSKGSASQQPGGDAASEEYKLNSVMFNVSYRMDW